MARRKTGSIFAVILVICLIAAAVGGIYYLTNGFKNEIKMFAVTVGEKTYVNNADGLTLKNGEKITVTNPFSDGYTVGIYPRELENDFELTVGDEVWHWSDIPSVDCLKSFGYKKTTDGFTIEYVNISTIIANMVGYNVDEIIVNSVSGGDLFEMRITSKNSTIILGFTLENLYVTVSGIDIDQNGIIF